MILGFYSHLDEVFPTLWSDSPSSKCAPVVMVEAVAPSPRLIHPLILPAAAACWNDKLGLQLPNAVGASLAAGRFGLHFPAVDSA